MITQIKQIIGEHPEWLRSPESSLSFLKASTPASGAGKWTEKGKVLLFVFEEGERLPTLCIKTVRVYSAGDVIRCNYDNLQLLRDGVVGSTYIQMFAKPLYLYNDGDLVFSIETICPGTKFSQDARSVELVVEKYIAWQSHLAKKTKKFRILQQGDMTPDNVLVSGQNVYLVDYDYVGTSYLPGFDLFNFLSKIKLSPEALHTYYEQYFPRYFKAIGAQVKSYSDLFPLYNIEESKRKAKK